MSNLAQHVQREVPRFAERERNLVGADSFDVARVQLRNESPMGWQVRRTSSRHLPRSQSAVAAPTGDMRMHDSLLGRSLTAVVETCVDTVDVSARVAAPNGHS